MGSHEAAPRAADQQSSAKLSYEKPRLRVFGDVGELTQNVGKNGNMDGVGGNKTMA